MGRALQFIHASDIVHNDLKPANILFHPDRGAVLIDFGLGGKAGDVHYGGTPWYLPPEFLDDSSHSRGAPGDMFALGVTMLYALRKSPLPEIRQQSWRIADIHTTSSASSAMRRWLVEV